MPQDVSQACLVYALYEGSVVRAPVRRTSLAQANGGNCVIAQQRVFPPVCCPLRACECVWLMLPLPYRSFPRHRVSSSFWKCKESCRALLVALLVLGTQFPSYCCMCVNCIALSWGIMELTDAAGVAREGWWRIPMFRSTPDPTLAYEVLGTHMRYTHFRRPRLFSPCD